MTNNQYISRWTLPISYAPFTVNALKVDRLYNTGSTLYGPRTQGYGQCRRVESNDMHTVPLTQHPVFPVHSIT